MTTTKKDRRKTFTHQRIVTSNNDVIYFDGKFDPETKVMKVYRLHGSVLAFQDAYDTIGVEYGCDKVLGPQNSLFMSYTIRYSTKNGGSVMATCHSNLKAKIYLRKLAKEQREGRVEKNGIVIGESYKQDGKWLWYIDSEA